METFAEIDTAVVGVMLLEMMLHGETKKKATEIDDR